MQKNSIALIGIYTSNQYEKINFRKICTQLFKSDDNNSAEIDYVEVKHLLIAIIKNQLNFSLHHLLKTSKNILLGKVFSKNIYNPLTLDELDRVEDHEYFVKNYWGEYLLISIKEGHEIELLRAPTGNIPLFYTSLDTQTTIFASNLQYLCRLLPSKPKINHENLAAILSLGAELHQQTMFEGVNELLHGCQLIFSLDGIKKRLIWNPADYVNQSENIESLSSRLPSVLIAVTKAWLGEVDSVLLELSGGTDSSALLHSCKHAQTKNQILKAIHMFHPDIRSSDERLHARAVAQEVGIDLIEFNVQQNLPFDQEFTLPNLPNHPTSELLDIKFEHDLTLYFQKQANSCFVSGHGGDHIFIASVPPTVLSDMIIEQGVTGLTKHLKEFSMLNRKPIFWILTNIIDGLKKYYLPFGRYTPHTISHAKKVDWHFDDFFSLRLNTQLHPFYTSKFAKKVMPGQFSLIDAVYGGLASIQGEVRKQFGCPTFYPFLTQPMIELALSIPTYKSYANGFSRYIFRKSINNFFNTQHVWRKDKGTVGGILLLGFKKHESEIKELCLNGYCAQKNFIDRTKLLKHLNRVLSGSQENLAAIFNLLTAELFIRYWSSEISQ